MDNKKVEKIDYKEQFRIFKKIMSFTKEWRMRYIALFIAISIMSTVLYLIWMPATVGHLFEELNNNRPDRFILWLVIRIVSVFVAMSISMRLWIGLRKTCTKITVKIKKTLFAHMVYLPISVFEDSHTGDMLSRLTTDVITTEGVFDHFLVRIVLSTSGLLMAGGYLLALSWQIFVMAVVLGLITMFFHSLYAKYILKHSQEVQKTIGDATRLFMEIMTGAWAIRIFGLHRHTDEEGERFFGKVRDAEMKRVKREMSRDFFVYTLDGLIIGTTLIVSIMLLKAGVLTIINMMIVSSLSVNVAFSLRSFGINLVNFQKALAGAERVVEILDIPIEEIENDGIKKDTKYDLDNDIAISFNKLKFSYNEDSCVFNDFTCDLKNGTSLAIVGMSGGGKSTLFKLLMGFYQPSDGDITIFGKNYRDFTLDELRSLLAYVPQENYLFNSTIKENLLFSKKNATDEEILKVCKAANAHDFIMKLENGYETVVGERGTMLSGGQRQRIAIARALLKDAPILLLDEATASLDTESEREVQIAIERLMKGRSTIVVAHRLATVENADIIIVLEDGCIKETGKHENLLNKDDRYAWYYNMQFKSV